MNREKNENSVLKEEAVTYHTAVAKAGNSRTNISGRANERRKKNRIELDTIFMEFTIPPHIGTPFECAF